MNVSLAIQSLYNVILIHPNVSAKESRGEEAMSMAVETAFCSISSSVPTSTMRKPEKSTFYQMYGQFVTNLRCF